MATRIAGWALPEVTATFAARCQETLGLHPAAFRQLPSGLTISSIGVGTYQGELGQEHDDLVVAAVKESVLGGINVVDTAVNYRLQQAERCVGKALWHLCMPADASGSKAEAVQREALFISTKAGFIPGDYSVTADKEEGMQHTAKALVEAGVPAETICAGFRHCLHPKALDVSLARSLDNLGLETVDLFYLHNAENQTGMGVPKDELMARISAAFVWCEQMRAANKIRAYGLATWDAFRVSPLDSAHLSLTDLATAAADAANSVHGAGMGHGLLHMQIPVNLGFSEAIRSPTQQKPAEAEDTKAQQSDGPLIPSLAWGISANLGIFASSSLGGGAVPDLASKCEGHALMAGRPDGVARWLEFTRSCPGVCCALVGMKRPSNVASNLALMRYPPLEPADFSALCCELYGESIDGALGK